MACVHIAKVDILIVINAQYIVQLYGVGRKSVFPIHVFNTVCVSPRSLLTAERS